MSRWEETWQPINNNVIVKTTQIEEKTKGGVIIPDSVKDREQEVQDIGVIVKMGERAFDFLSENERPAVGDSVMFARYDGKSSEGGKYRILVDEDIIAKQKNRS